MTTGLCVPTGSGSSVPCSSGQWSLTGMEPCSACTTTNGPGTSLTSNTGCNCNGGFTFNSTSGTCDSTCTAGSLAPGATCTVSTESCCSTGVCLSSKCTCTATSQCLSGQYCSLSPIPSATSLCEQLITNGNSCSIQGQCSSGWCYYSGGQDPLANPPSGLTGVCKATTALLADGAFCTVSTQCVSAICGSDGKCGGAPNQSCSSQTGSTGCRTGSFCMNLNSSNSPGCYFTYPTYKCTLAYASNTVCLCSSICAIVCASGYYCDTNNNNIVDAGEDTTTCSSSIHRKCK